MAQTANDSNPIHQADIARSLLGSGYSIIPIRVDGSKAPAVKDSWEPFMQRCATKKEIASWYKTPKGIGIVCGSISGGLEVIDFDKPGIAEEFFSACAKEGKSELVNKLVHVQTPKPGLHLIYRCPEIEGNQKLARYPNPDKESKQKWLTAIETRGEGGYIVGAGSPAECHPNNKEYKVISGDLSGVPQITPDDRNFLIRIARTFDEYKEADAPTSGTANHGSGSSDLRPGDDYNERADWEELLTSLGWKKKRTKGVESFWMRPGKTEGAHGGTLNYEGSNLFHVFSSNAFPFEPNQTYNKFEVFTLHYHNGDHSAAARELACKGYGTQRPKRQEPEKAPPERARESTQANNSPSEAKDKQATIILSLVQDIQLFCTPDRRAYATVNVRNHAEMLPIGSKDFSSWLSLQYYNHTKNSPSATAVKEAVSLLESKALFDPTSKVEKIHIRLAGDDNCIWLDLGDDERNVVEISPTGWKIVTTCGAKFRRPNGMAALPIPARGGSIASLRDFINCSDSDFKLIVGWILGALRPTGPFPILEIDGEQGSAKSSLTKLLKRLFDPTDALLNSPPTDAREVALIANSEYVVAYDNLSHLTAELQDVFCRTALGGAFKTRRLYSNDEVETFRLFVPVIFNSIGGVATRPDLLDRVIKVVLAAINEESRVDEKTFWAKFFTAHPKVLGALCDCISQAMAALPSTTLPAKPRLADFATWIHAAESYLCTDKRLNWQPGDFLALLCDSQASAASSVLEGDEFAQAVISLGREQHYWSGTATDLLAKLGSTVSEAAKKSRLWPAANTLHARLMRIAPLLRKESVSASRSPGRLAKVRATYVVQEIEQVLTA